MLHHHAPPSPGTTGVIAAGTHLHSEFKVTPGTSIPDPTPSRLSSCCNLPVLSLAPGVCGAQVCWVCVVRVERPAGHQPELHRTALPWHPAGSAHPPLCCSLPGMRAGPSRPTDRQRCRPGTASRWRGSPGHCRGSCAPHSVPLPPHPRCSITHPAGIHMHAQLRRQHRCVEEGGAGGGVGVVRMWVLASVWGVSVGAGAGGVHAWSIRQRLPCRQRLRRRCCLGGTATSSW